MDVCVRYQNSKPWSMASTCFISSADLQRQRYVSLYRHVLTWHASIDTAGTSLSRTCAQLCGSECLQPEVVEHAPNKIAAGNLGGLFWFKIALFCQSHNPIFSAKQIAGSSDLKLLKMERSEKELRTVSLGWVEWLICEDYVLLLVWRLKGFPLSVQK